MTTFSQKTLFKINENYIKWYKYNKFINYREFLKNINLENTKNKLDNIDIKKVDIKILLKNIQKTLYYFLVK